MRLFHRYIEMKRHHHVCGHGLMGMHRIVKIPIFLTKLRATAAFVSGMAVIGTFVLGNLIIRLVMIKKAKIDTLEINNLRIKNMEMNNRT
jgi:hypothetical protein